MKVLVKTDSKLQQRARLRHGRCLGVNRLHNFRLGLILAFTVCGMLPTQGYAIAGIRFKEQVTKVFIRAWLASSGQTQDSELVDYLYARFYFKFKNIPFNVTNSEFVYLLPRGSTYLGSGQQSDVFLLPQDQYSSVSSELQTSLVRKLRRLNQDFDYRLARKISDFLIQDLGETNFARIVKIDEYGRYADFEYVNGLSLSECIRTHKCSETMLKREALKWSELYKNVHLSLGLKLDISASDNFKVIQGQTSLIDTLPATHGPDEVKPGEVIDAWLMHAHIDDHPCVRALTQIFIPGPRM